MYASDVYIYNDVYIYIERERDRSIATSIDTCIYISLELNNKHEYVFPIDLAPNDGLR